MKHQRFLAFCLLTAMSTTACNAALPVPKPEPKLNPAPTVYEITVTIKDAPGPFDSIDGFTQFEVLNDECVPLDYTAALGGVRINPKKNVPVKYEAVGNGTYQATVVADPFVDEDYYGLGVCHWTLVATKFVAHAGQATFYSGVSGNELDQGTKVLLHSARYFDQRNPAEEDMPSFGETSRNAFGADVILFEIAMTPTRK